MVKRLLTFLLALPFASFAVAQLQSGSPWPKVHGNLQNTNEGLGAGITTPLLEWTWGSSSDHCGPAIISANGSLYFGDSNSGANTLVALNSATGLRVWQNQVDGQVVGSPAIGSDGTVYVGTANGSLYAFTDTGTSANVKWKYSAPGAVTGSPTVATNGTIVFASGVDLLGISDSGTSGTQLWENTLGGSIQSSPVIGTDGNIYIGADDDKFYAFSSNGGALTNWQSGSSSAITQDSSIVPDGHILALAGHIEYDLSPVTLGFNGGDNFGSLIGTAAVPGASYFFPSQGAGSSGDYIIAWPSQSWFYRAGANTSTPSAIQATDGTLYFASDKLYSLTNTGSLNWSYAISPQAPMAMDAGGALYMPDSVNGGFAAIGGKSMLAFTLASNSVQSGSNTGSNPLVGTVQFASGISQSSAESGISFSYGNADVYGGGLSTTSPTGSNNTYNFWFYSNAVSSTETVTITATYGSQTEQQSLQLTPATVTQLLTASGATPATHFVGGTNINFTAYLSGGGYPSAVTASLSSSSTDVTVPSTLSFSAAANGSNPVTDAVSLTTSPVSSEEQVTLTVTYGSSSQQATVYLEPAPVSTFTMSPNSIQGGTTANGTITLTGNAGPTGNAVSLSSGSGDVTVPSTVTVPAGTNTTTVHFSTSPVASSEVVTLTATVGSASVQAMVTLNPPTISSVKLLPNGSIQGGAGINCALFLSGKAGPGGAVVNISSDNSDAKVPTSVTVPAGSSATNFTFFTNSVSSQETITITGSYNSTTAQATLTLNPSGVSSIKLLPNSTITGGMGTDLVVFLTEKAGPSGTTVNLSSSSTDANIPTSIFISSGQSANNVTFFTSPVSSTEMITLTATVGSTSANTQLTLNPAGISSMKLLPASIQGGAGSDCAVFLTEPAGPSGATINLSSNNADANIPATLAISAGASAGHVTFFTNAVASTETITITGTLGSSTSNTVLTLNPATVASIKLLPSSTVTGGKPTDLAVFLTGKAGPGGVMVTLQSSDPSVTVPSSVTIAGGSSATSFNIQTSKVNSQKTVTITATVGSTTVQTVLTVNATT